MTEVIVECRGGVVQKVTVLGEPVRVVVLDRDEFEGGCDLAATREWPVPRGARPSHRKRAPLTTACRVRGPPKPTRRMFDRPTIHTQFTPDREIVVFPGDCREFLSSVPNASFQLVVTSPP